MANFAGYVPNQQSMNEVPFAMANSSHQAAPALGLQELTGEDLFAPIRWNIPENDEAVRRAWQEEESRERSEQLNVSLFDAGPSPGQRRNVRSLSALAIPFQRDKSHLH